MDNLFEAVDSGDVLAHPRITSTHTLGAVKSEHAHTHCGHTAVGSHYFQGAIAQGHLNHNH